MIAPFNFRFFQTDERISGDETCTSRRNIEIKKYLCLTLAQGCIEESVGGLCLSDCQRRNVERRRSRRRSLKRPIANPHTHGPKLWYAFRTNDGHTLFSTNLLAANYPMIQVITIRSSKYPTSWSSAVRTHCIVCYHVARWNYAETAELDAIEALPRNDHNNCPQRNSRYVSTFPRLTRVIIVHVCVCVCEWVSEWVSEWVIEWVRVYLLFYSFALNRVSHNLFLD